MSPVERLKKYVLFLYGLDMSLKSANAHEPNRVTGVTIAATNYRVVFVGQDDCRLEEFTVPDIPDDGHVVIQNLASLMSAGTELAVLRRSHRSFATGGPRAEIFKYPYFPGYASVGRVTSVGRDVTTMSKGDLVWHPGPHATAAVMPAADCRVVPEGIAPEDAVFFGLVEIAITAIRRAPSILGERVLVSGLGLVGILCGQLYKLAGARVAAADFSNGRVLRARQLGFSPVIDLAENSLPEWYQAHPGEEASLVVEAAGVENNISDCLKVAARNGRVVLLGSPRNSMEIDPYTDIHVKGLKIIGAHAPLIDKEARDADAPYLFELCGDALQLGAIRSHVVPFTEVADVYDRLESELDKYLGVVLSY